MHRTPWGLRGSLLAAALSVALPAAADPLADPRLTAEEPQARSSQISIAIYGVPPQMTQMVLAIPQPVILATMLNGTWRGSGSDGDKMGWSLTFTIHAGRYTLEGDPPLKESGGVALASIPVVNADGEETLTVRFFDRVMDGSPTQDRTETWTLSADKQRFTRPVYMTFTRDPDAAPTTAPTTPPALDDAP